MSRRPPAASTSADLSALLTTEQRLELLVAEARDEGERIRAEARDRAERREAEATAQLDTAVAELTAEIEQATAARLAALEAEADQAITRWDALDGDALATAATAVLAALRARLTEPS